MLFLFSVMLTCSIANAQTQGEMLNKLQHAVSSLIIYKDTVEFKSYFTDEQSFQRAKNFLISIGESNKGLKMTTDQIGVYNKVINGIDSLTIVYMGGHDELHKPAMLGQMVLTTNPDNNEWLFKSVKSVISAKKVKDPLRYLQIYINMQDMPPPPIQELD